MTDIAIPPPAGMSTELCELGIATYDRVTAASMTPATEGGPGRTQDQATLDGLYAAVHQGYLAGQAAGIQAGRKQAFTDALAAFAKAYSRSGSVIDADVVDDELAEHAEKAEGSFRRYRDLFRLDLEHELRFPAAALDALLAVLAGARAAFGMSDVPTARQIVEAMAAEDVTTCDGDTHRLHLFAVHGKLAALGFTDREAGLMHSYEHQTTEAGHDEGVLDWTDAQIVARLNEVPDSHGGGLLRAQYAVHTDRRTVASRG